MLMTMNGFRPILSERSASTVISNSSYVNRIGSGIDVGSLLRMRFVQTAIFKKRKNRNEPATLENT